MGHHSSDEEFRNSGGQKKFSFLLLHCVNLLSSKFTFSEESGFQMKLLVNALKKVTMHL